MGGGQGVRPRAGRFATTFTGTAGQAPSAAEGPRPESQVAGSPTGSPDRRSPTSVERSAGDRGVVPVLPRAGGEPLALGDDDVLRVLRAGHAGVEDPEPGERGARGEQHA